MQILYLSLIGLLVGLVLDALIVRLAVRPDASEEPADPDEEAADQRPAPGHALIHAEAGSMVVDVSPAHVWARRLIVVGATAGLFAVTAARYQETSHLAVVTAYVSVLLLCASTDVLSFRVPNVVTYPAIIGALIIGMTMPGADIAEALAGGALAGGVLLLPALLTGGVGMGMGDVKLVAFGGFAVGFANVAPALLFMGLGGGGAAILLLLSGRRKRREPIPYAPFISAGVLATLLWQGTAFVALT
jgi:prepilin signal peptidase PulO-like enzyme (type II secretory pathway)